MLYLLFPLLPKVLPTSLPSHLHVVSRYLKEIKKKTIRQKYEIITKTCTHTQIEKANMTIVLCLPTTPGCSACPGLL